MSIRQQRGPYEACHRGDARRTTPGHRMCSRHVTGMQRSLQPRRYEIRVRGHLGETICSAFPQLQASTSGATTVLTGVLADQAALYGVLSACEALGLDLLDVRSRDQHNDHADVAE